MILEYKNSRAGVKDVDTKGRIVTGYLSSFGNEDLDHDVFVKGAYSKSLIERKGKIFFLNQHDFKQPHGLFATLTEDQKGLYFESNPLPDTTYSNDVLKLYDAGIMKEHSVGFKTIEFERKGNGRVLKEVKLYEGSNVTMGANPETPFLGLKAGLSEIEDMTTKIYGAIRNGDFSDDTFVLLEFALKQLQKNAFELGKKSLSGPFEDTPINEPMHEATKAIMDYLTLKQ